MKQMALILATLALLVAGCSRGPGHCAVCQRAECQGLAFRVTLENDRLVETCCPRCGLHYLKVNQLKARTLQATDFASGQWIDAKQAVYVEGSDLAHCAMKETKRDAYGCCAFKDFDRCLPSLLAFAEREAAASFQKQHGGAILPFEKLSK